MKRNDFINRLFNNGDGLTLDQIERIEQNALPDIIPDGVIEEVGERQAREKAREVFIDVLADLTDMLELRDYIRELFKTDPILLTDMQVYRLFYAVCGGRG